jgi:hypothetical protein
MKDNKNTIDIAHMICAVSENLRTQYEILSQIPHHGERGHQLEKALARVIEPYLPRRFGLGTGHVIGSEPFGKDAQSLQTDIVLYDALDTAPLFVGQDYKIFWYETVHAVIEVKSKLNSSGLKDALENIQAVKRLTKPDSSKSIFGIIFAYASEWSVKNPIKTITSNLKENTRGYDIGELADLIFILDAGRRDEWQEYKIDTTRDAPEDYDDRLALTFELSSDGNYHPIVVQKGAFFWFIVTVLKKLGISKPFEYFPRSFVLNMLEFIEWSPEK